MKYSASVVFLMFVFSNSAEAVNFDFGISTGIFKQEYSASGEPSTESGTDNGYGLYFTVYPIKNVGIKTSITYFGNACLGDSYLGEELFQIRPGYGYKIKERVDTKGEALTVGGVYTSDISESGIRYWGELGLSLWTAEIELKANYVSMYDANVYRDSADDTGVSPYGGLGVAYHFSSNISVGAKGLLLYMDPSINGVGLQALVKALMIDVGYVF